MATSPLLLTLLGAGAIGRRKRDVDATTDTKPQRFYLTPYEISKIIYGTDKLDYTKIIKKDNVPPTETTKPAIASPAIITFSTPFTQLLEKLFRTEGSKNEDTPAAHKKST